MTSNKKGRDKDYITAFDPKVCKRVPYTIGTKFAHSTASSSSFPISNRKVREWKKKND